MSDDLPYILICQTCGRQRDIPLENVTNGKSGWLRCECTATVFSVRLRDLREALLKEPHK